jgi:hypothetical protein
MSGYSAKSRTGDLPGRDINWVRNSPGRRELDLELRNQRHFLQVTRVLVLPTAEFEWQRRNCSLRLNYGTTKASNPIRQHNSRWRQPPFPWFRYQNHFSSDVLFIINLSNLEDAFVWIGILVWVRSRRNKMVEVDGVGVEGKWNIISRSSNSRNSSSRRKW